MKRLCFFFVILFFGTVFAFGMITGTIFMSCIIMNLLYDDIFKRFSVNSNRACESRLQDKTFLIVSLFLT